MSDSIANQHDSLSKFDELLECILREFPDSRVLSQDEVDKLNLSPFIKPRPKEDIKRTARKGAGRATASAGKRRQNPAQGTLSYLSCHGGKE